MGQNLKIFTMEPYTWLTIAFSRSSNLVESFYYDKRDREFYSIQFGDLFILNEDMTLNENASSSDPLAVQQLIADRVQREDKSDPDIVTIYPLKVEHRKEIMRAFLDQISDPYLLRILEQRIINQDGSQQFDFYMGDEATESVKSAWETFKQARLAFYIDLFLQEHGIDLKVSRVWDADEDVDVTVKLK
jgi:hypothetical protein